MSDYAGVYIVLGAEDTVRDTLLIDILKEAADKGPVRLFNCGPAQPELEVQTSALGIAWATGDAEAGARAAEDRPEAESLFLLSDGRADPRDSLEVWGRNFQEDPFPLLRVILIVNAELIHRESSLQHWYEACLHFSDVALFSNWTQLPAKWVSDWETAYHKSHNPCLLIKVARRGIPNIPLVLFPESRRISLVFEMDDRFQVSDWEIEESAHEDDEEGEDTIEDVVEADPWLERLPGGARRRHVPGIGRFL
jgi:hypothetical protein